jgi:Glycoside hydrolase family 44
MSGRRMLALLLAGAVVAVAGLGSAALVSTRLRHRLLAEVRSLSAPRPEQTAIGDLSAVVVSVDGNAAGSPISPLIYGVAGASGPQVRELGATLNRWGGNPSSTYNWVQGQAWNAGRDWEFRNVDYYGQPGSAADAFVTSALGAGAVPLITIPTLGYVSRDGDNQKQSVGVPGDGGAPLRAGSFAIAGYNPSANQARTSVPSLPSAPGPLPDRPDQAAPVVYQDEWVHHLVTQFGAGPGGVGYFAMDNEPDLWSYTHTDVHPARMSYDDMLANFETYARAVKAAAPRALILGPDVSGWTAYEYSALDAGSDRYATHADRQAHGGQAFLPWWLGQVRRQDAAAGTRTLDLLDVHYYPQADGVYSPAADPATRALRIRSTRSLWDPNYSDESWIGEPVNLLPRLKSWINTEYPGTGIAITEYGWGGEKDASGAVALADVLGIFGREGVSLAAYWTYPPPDSPTGAAFRLYRNFDGKGGTFGDRSLPTRVNQAGVSAFAARHSGTGETDVVLVNESQDASAHISLRVSGLGSGHADEFLVRPGSSSISELPADLSGPIVLPPLSISLVRVSG